MVVNPYKKFVFVSIAKCASTSIRRRLGYFNDPPPEEYHMFLKDILLLHPYAVDYFKFAFVRNPYDRLYSTYINLKHDGHDWATAIKKRKSFKDCVMNLEGSEYSKYIHLQPQAAYITVDEEIAVDYLGRFENLKQDFFDIESVLGLSHVALAKERYSRKVPEDPKIYDEEMKEVVRRFYKEDFERFGYDK